MKSDEGVVPDVVPSGVGAVSGDETDLPPQWTSTHTNSRKTSSRYEWLWRSSR